MEPKKESSNHSFDYHLACELKVVEKAILVGYFQFWISENEKRKSSLHCRQGEYWTYTTVPELIKTYPYMKGSSVYRWLDQLEADEWLKSARLNEKNIDQTRWYGRGKRLIDWLKNPIYQNDNSGSQNGKWDSQNGNSGYQNDNSDSQNGNSAIYKDTVVNPIVNPVVNAHKKNAGEVNVLKGVDQSIPDAEKENPPNPVPAAPSPELTELEIFTIKLKSNNRLLYKLSSELKLKGDGAEWWIRRFILEQWTADLLKERNDADLILHCQRWIASELKKPNPMETPTIAMKPTPNLKPQSPSLPDSANLSEPNTAGNASGQVAMGEMNSELLHDHLGFPTPEQQAEYDATNRRIAEKRAKFFSKTSSVVPVDYDKQTPEGAAHRQKVADTPTVPRSNASRLDSILSRVATIRKPGREHVLPFEEAQIIVRSIYEQDLASRERMPYWTEESFAVVDEVTKYFIGDPSCQIPLSKCLYVYGAVGVGKTYLFRMMAILCEVVPITKMAFRMVSTKRLLRAISDAKSLKPLAKIEQGNWLIDELGGEKKLIKVYGDSEDPMDYLINSCYEGYIDNGKKTHYTSNKQPDETEAIYGTRNYDRFCEMVEPILFPGTSIRIDPNTVADDDLDHFN